MDHPIGNLIVPHELCSAILTLELVLCILLSLEITYNELEGRYGIMRSSDRYIGCDTVKLLQKQLVFPYVTTFIDKLCVNQI